MRKERPSIRRKAFLLLRTTAALVVVGSLGVAWVANQPSIEKGCTLAATIDEVGAATPEAAWIRLATESRPDFEVKPADHTSGSGDRVTARYLHGPKHGRGGPDTRYYQEVVTERGSDHVWRVVSANECAETKRA